MKFTHEMFLAKVNSTNGKTLMAILIHHKIYYIIYNRQSSLRFVPHMQLFIAESSLVHTL